MANSRLNVTTEWDAVRAHLPENYEELAHEHKQLLTQYGNAKISTADELLRLILLHVGADLPLRQTVAVMAEAGGPALSHVRLHKKLFRAVPYLRALVRGMVDTSEAELERWAGYQVVTVGGGTRGEHGGNTAELRPNVFVGQARDLNPPGGVRNVNRSGCDAPARSPIA